MYFDLGRENFSARKETGKNENKKQKNTYLIIIIIKKNKKRKMTIVIKRKSFQNVLNKK